MESAAELICARPTLIGEAGAFAAPKLKIRGFFLLICRASPLSGVRIAAPIVLAQYKEYERIGEARTPVRRASPIVKERAY